MAMKRRRGVVAALLCAALMGLCLLPAGCANALPVDVSSIQSLALYHFVVPAQAECAVWTDPETVAGLAAELGRLPAPDPEVVGQDILSCRLHLADGTTYEAVFAGDADLWARYGAAARPASESELPQP